MKRTNVHLTLAFVHRDEAYRAKISARLTSYAASFGVTLDVRYADELRDASGGLGTIDRVIVDGNSRKTINSIRRGNTAVPIYALVERLDAVGAYNFLNRGVIPVGRCDTELDAVFLTQTILEGVMVARTSEAKGRYAAEKEIEHRASIMKALVEHKFNVLATAEFLGMKRTTLQYQMKKFGMIRKPEA
jgi:ActR/RegA family two-component response regulator